MPEGDGDEIGRHEECGGVVSPPHAVSDGGVFELALSLHGGTWPIWARIDRTRPESTIRPFRIGRPDRAFRSGFH